MKLEYTKQYKKIRNDFRKVLVYQFNRTLKDVNWYIENKLNVPSYKMDDLNKLYIILEKEFRKNGNDN